MKTFEEITKNNGSYTLDQIALDHGIPQGRSQIRPGRFYRFRTMSPAPNLNEETVLDLSYGKGYYDLTPTGLLLYHENWQQTALVLNLKVIPSNISAKLLEAYYYISSQNGMTSLFKEGKLIPLEERQLLDRKFYLLTTSVLSNLIGFSNLNYAINKYDVDDILEARLIDWDKFGMLVQPKVSVIGLFPDTLNLTQVFEKFITNSI